MSRLSGPGTGRGITAFTADQGVAFLEVVNGRLQNWDVAVAAITTSAPGM